MNATLLKASIIAVPVIAVFCYSIALFRQRAPWSGQQLSGAACLAVVVLTHFCEGLHLFPWMGWGAEHSAGHYLDLSGAVLGLTLFLTGWLMRLFAARRILR